jgi:hypothetical protein
MAAKKKNTRKRTKPKTRAKSKPTASARKSVRKSRGHAKRVARKKKPASVQAFSRRSRGRGGEQSGDLQGLSRRQGADSESVDELLEEGNAFEAGVVSGVEEADAMDEREVHTREVPEDDVPGEYLDKDS